MKIRPIRRSPTVALAVWAAMIPLWVHCQTNPGPTVLILTNAPPKPLPHWESALTASLALTRGNSRTLTASGAATTQEKWDDNQIKLGLDGTYGQQAVGTNTSVNPNMIHGFGQYDRFFARRWFGYLHGEGLHDDVADIAYRASASPGLGYSIIKAPSGDLNVEAGPGYVWQRQGGEVDNFFTMRVAESFTHKFNDRAKIWEKTEWLPKVEDIHYYVVNSEAGVSAALTSDNKLALTVTVDYSYNSQPATGRLKNDTILKTGITYAF